MTTAPDVVAEFKRLFARHDPAVPLPIDRLYAPDVVFEDPFRRVAGADAVRAYFARMDAGILLAEFAFADEAVAGGTAALAWVMTVRLRRPRRTLVVPGATVLRFADRITYQRDYFDAGAMLYEQLPVVGRALRWVKRQVA